MRAFPSISLALLLVTGACNGAPSEGEGEGEGDAGEGEGEGEGEGDPAPVEYQWEHADGSAIPGDVLDLGDVDAAAGDVTIDLAIENLGATDFAVLTDPPILVAGTNADAFTVVTQPPDVVPAGQRVTFSVTFTPGTSGAGASGALEGKLLFAYGLTSAERAVLTIDANVGGTPAPTPGVHFDLYDGAFSGALPDFSTLTPADSGTLANFDISARTGADGFAFDFTGQIQIPADDDYTFFTTSDDGSRLFIDGAVVVDNDGDHGPQEATGTANLTAGFHSIRVQFYENAGGELLTVEWASPGIAREAIPDDALFH